MSDVTEHERQVLDVSLANYEAMAASLEAQAEQERERNSPHAEWTGKLAKVARTTADAEVKDREPAA